MKKVSILLIAVSVFAVVLSGYVSAQEETEPTEEQLEAYEAEEAPPDQLTYDNEMEMFSEEAVQQVGNAEAENSDAETETAEEEENDEEMVTTYSEEDTESEMEECTLWSCALYKMIVAVVGIGASAFWIFMLVDVLKLDITMFPADRAYRKWLWFAGVLFFWVIGATVYYFEIFRKQHQKSPGDK